MSSSLAYTYIFSAVITVVVTVILGFYYSRISKRQQLETNRTLEELRERDEDPEEKRFLLLAQYHSTSLSQSKNSFWFSLIFASLGFLVIVMPLILTYFSPANPVNGNVGILKSPQILNLISGTVIEAVAALFFVQSNRARRLLVDFFDRLRQDSKLENALSLASQINNKPLRDKLRTLIALDFAVEQPNPTKGGVLTTTLEQSGFLSTLLDLEYQHPPTPMREEPPTPMREDGHQNPLTTPASPANQVASTPEEPRKEGDASVRS